MATPPSIPPTLSYATPASLAARSGEIRVDGKQIIGPTDLTLPDRCAKCDAPGAVRMTRKYRWHRPELFILIIFPGLLIYAIVALIVQKKGSAHFSLCALHQKRRKNLILGVILAAFAVIGVAIGGAVAAANHYVDDDYVPLFVMLGIFGSIVCAVVGIMKARIFVPKYIDASVMRLEGGGAPFLESLKRDSVASGH